MEEKQQVENERETLEREKHKVIEKIGNYNENIELRSNSQKVLVLFCSIGWGLYINLGIHALQVFVLWGKCIILCGENPSQFGLHLTI